MALSTRMVPRHDTLTSLSSTVTLALWRFRQTWFMLCMVGIGTIASVMFVCAVPLFSEISMTAGLRGLLAASPETPYILLHTDAKQITSSSVNSIAQQLQPSLQSSIGRYISAAPESFIQTQGMPMLSPALHPAHGHDGIRLYGVTVNHVAAHVTLVQGRLPQTSSSGLEVALTPDSAQMMHVGVGSTIVVQVKLASGGQGLVTEAATSPNLTLHVVGLFNPAAGNDTFWHGMSFESTPQGQFTLYSALVSNDAFLASMTQMTKQGRLIFIDAPALLWYYRLDAARITIDQLNPLADQLATLQAHISNGAGSDAASQPPYIQDASLAGATVGSYDTPGVLTGYRQRIDVAQVPITILSVQVLALVLFFLAMMTDFLVDRQSDAIAILRSRGASRRQIFGSLIAQGAGLGLIALIVGPLLALVVVYFGAQHLLPAQDQSALNVITADPLRTVLGLKWYALGAVLVAIGAIAVALLRAVNMDVLSVRRQSARTTRLPLWQRLYLDVIAAIVALVGYGISQYVLHSGALDPRNSILFSAPLSLIAPLFLVIAGILLLLRLFPRLLNFCAHLALRSRGAVPMLALAQMARASGQFVRMTLLLAFAIAFAIFTLVFTASQNQHVLDVAAYQVGADFSGTPVNAAAGPSALAQQAAAYGRIPGVLAASAGLVDQATTEGNAQTVHVTVQAVDPATFGRTVNWSADYSRQPIDALMRQLAQAAASGPSNSATPATPAIIDASLWQALALSPGATFLLVTSNGPMNFVALAEVQHIPPLYDSTAGASPGGILVDYTSYDAAYSALVKSYTKNADAHLPLNYIWLRTRQDPASLSSVRNALSQGQLQLAPLYDRHAIVSNLQSDPLYLDLINVLLFGAATALLLAVLGNLLASWLSARSRLLHFVVLRALGSAPQQVANVLLWEQCIVYTAAVLLGLLFGLFLAFTVAPTLVFSSVPGLETGGNQFLTLEHVVPVQVVFPASLGIVLPVLILICLAALGLMVRTVSRPAMNQVIRINND